MLNFIFTYLKDNRLKIFKWKLLHHILPCKQLLFQWKIKEDSKCDLCNVTEDYKHFFLECRYFKTFWEKIKILLNKVKIGHHILNYRNLIIGYTISDINHYDINLLVTLITFSIHKCTQSSNFKTTNFDVYALFKKDFLNYLNISTLSGGKHGKILKEISLYI